MQLDLLLLSIKQVLNDRKLMSTLLQQLRAAHDDPVLSDMVVLDDSEDSVRILSESDEVDIVFDNVRILSQEPSHPLEIEISEDEPPPDHDASESSEIPITILSTESRTEPDGEEDSDGPSADADPVVTVGRDGDEDSSDLTLSLDDLAFDDHWARTRIDEIKRHIEHGKRRIEEIESARSQTVDRFARNYRALTQDYSGKLSRCEQEKDKEIRSHQNRMSRMERQIREAGDQLQQKQRRLTYRLLSWLGLIKTETCQVESLRQQKLQESTNHHSLLHLYNGQYSHIEAESQQRANALVHNHQQDQEAFTNQLNQIYQEMVHELIPEGEGILEDWLTHLATQLRQWHPDWEDPVWSQLETEHLHNHESEQNRGLRVGTLVYERPTVSIPALIDPVGNHRHVFIQGGESDTRAVQMRATLLRLLLAFPIGLARILLIDGIEQGRTLTRFATILHEDICGGKVYDLESDIAEELTRIRNRISRVNHHVLVEHDSLEDYNRANREVPCPYQFVVINNFPAGFNSQALQALRDIIRNGPRAGVYVLATVDERPQRLHDFKLEDFISGNYLLKSKGIGPLGWNSEYLDEYEVRAEGLPSDHMVTRALTAVSRAFEEKPTILRYERITRELPPLWSQSTRDGMRAPIGLTFGGKPHVLELSDRFAHGLVGGRTGSGKTVLLHNLVCGLAQLHSPDELQLFLLDFAGTEFNVYAKENLPHARAVAVDCDAEIGLSVIMRLVDEIDRRRKVFDEADVRSLSRYRGEGHRLPRLLLIVDEVQMLTQAADSRLVRQVENGLVDLLRRGRKVGIHVLVGTQSPTSVLSGEMLQQMVIRICLLADQQVSRLVLGEMNEAASDLQKQGEAVYNAYNGQAEHNVLIRTALLERSRIADIVERLNSQAELQEFTSSEDLLYFDGRSRNALTENSLVAASLQPGFEPAPNHPLIVPVGNSIEIKEDTAVEFARRRYSNLVLAGGEDEDLHALLRNVVLGLCIRSRYDSVLFYVIDLSFDGAQLGSLMRAFQAMPHEFHFARNSQAGVNLIEEVYAEFEDRQERARHGVPAGQSIFLTVFGMENFHDLRGEDRFSRPEIRKRFDQLVADGPSLGIHGIVAVQTLAKGAILEPNSFGLRLCFQVAEDDSRALLDSEAATKLMRRDRAIFRRRDWPYGKVEKFKPYLPPTRETVVNLANFLVRRAQKGREDSQDRT